MKALLFVLQILPALIDALKAVEGVWPEAGKGREKLEFVRKLLLELYPDVEKYWPALERAIALLVTWFNDIGVFKKG
jgi:hypothetical protein